ncbi:MAG TPA: GNAT family N-acetyltransferase [Gammaproteobacteria bacterium]
MQTSVSTSSALLSPSVGITAAQPSHIELVEDENGLQALRAEWQDVLKASMVDCLFLSWEWLSVWWKNLSGGRRLHVLAVRRGDKLIGIAPWAVRPAQPGRLIPFRALEFMGMGDIGSDYLDLIARPEDEAEVVQAVGDYLEKHRMFVEFQRVKHSSQRMGTLVTHLDQSGWQTQRLITDNCAYLDLKGHSWKSYLSTVSRSHRANVNRRQRRLKESFQSVEFQKVTDETTRIACFKDFARLHALRWSGDESSTALTGPDVMAFHEEFSRLALGRGWLRLYVLKLDGKSVASTYSFRYGDVFYYYQAGYDPTYNSYSIGLTTLAMAIEQSIEEGITEIDFLHGEEEYKALWTRTRRDLERVQCFPPNIHGTLYRKAMGVRRNLKRLIRWPNRLREIQA